MNSAFRRRRSGTPDTYAGLNLIPLIDLCLNLVLIMLIIAPSLYLVRLPVQLPKADAGRKMDESWLRLALAKDGRLSLEGDLLGSWEELPPKLRGRRERIGKESLLLEIDRDVAYQEVSRLLSLLRREAPESRVAMGTTPEDSHAHGAR